MLWSCLLILVAFIVYAWTQLLNFQHRRKCVAHIPSVPAHIIARHLNHFHNKSNLEVSRMSDNILRWTDKTFKFWFGPSLWVILQEKDDVKTVLLQCSEKSGLYDLLPTFTDGSVLRQSVSEWRVTRQAMNIFSLASLKATIPIFNKNAQKVVTAIDELASNGQKFDLRHIMFRANFDNVSESFYDTIPDTKYSYGDHVMKALECVTSASFARVCQTYNFFDVIWKARQQYRIAEGYSNTLRNQIAQIRHSIELRRSLLQCSQLPSPLLIHKLLDRRNAGEITTAQVDTELTTLLIAGVETTAMTVAMSVLMLAMHPTAQARVHAEIAALNCTANKVTDVTHADTAHMPYTEMVLKETMRLFPPVPFMSRLITSDIRLTKCTLPQGTIAIIPVYRLQRSAIVWGHDHDQFVPERFSPERSHEFDPFFFMPFSHGPRNCIGSKYAMMSVRVFLCHLVTQYEFHTDMKFNELEIRRETTLHLENEYAITARRRL